MRKTPILLACAALMAVPAVGFAQSPAALANNETTRELRRLGLTSSGRMGGAWNAERRMSYQESWAAQMRARKAAKQAAREAEAAKAAAAKIDG
ncbi:hypothetical protein P7B02_16455 [Caulobacter segnis]|uniref:hypothetical protein n=1 Tax=Caulobacter segnis TaxID=88688 RepID=UPI00240FD0D6|nr:hypothetical protein [Caulobacter segnis]MDG2523124.1 hypothetical protein [Caulobacter segnis]